MSHQINEPMHRVLLARVPPAFAQAEALVDKAQRPVTRASMADSDKNQNLLKLPDIVHPAECPVLAQQIAALKIAQK